MIETLFLRRGFVDRNGVVLEGFLLTEMVLRRGVFIDENGGFNRGFIDRNTVSDKAFY